MSAAGDVMACGIFLCRPDYHVACRVCGKDVCLGGLSEFQRDRVLARSRMDSRPLAHADCATTEANKLTTKEAA